MDRHGVAGPDHIADAQALIRGAPHLGQSGQQVPPVTEVSSCRGPYQGPGRTQGAGEGDAPESSQDGSAIEHGLSLLKRCRELAAILQFQFHAAGTTLVSPEINYLPEGCARPDPAALDRFWQSAVAAQPRLAAASRPRLTPSWPLN